MYVKPEEYNEICGKGLTVNIERLKGRVDVDEFMEKDTEVEVSNGIGTVEKVHVIRMSSIHALIRRHRIYKGNWK